MTGRLLSVWVVLCFVSVLAWAQIAPPNEAGVSAGHEHLTTSNQDAYNAFFTAIGGIQQPLAPGGNTQIIKFPGVFLMAVNAGARGRGGRGAPADTATPAAPPAPPAPPPSSVGSSIDYLGFRVKDLKATLAKLAALKIQPMPGATAKQAFVMSPDNLKVSLKEDTSLTSAAATDEVLEKVTSVKDAAEWWSKWFGAKIVKDGNDTVAQIPGMNIRFLETKEAVAPTQGRALDHLGMEVRNLEAFMAKLAAGGSAVNVTSGYRGINPTQIPPLTGIGFVVDPWGTRIELNEGFKDVK
jgi:hypothetical protein